MYFERKLACIANEMVDVYENFLSKILRVCIFYVEGDMIVILACDKDFVR